MKTEVKEIPFNNGKLLGVRTEDGKVWLSIRNSCRDIGLTDAQGRAEVSKIQNSLLFKNEWQKLSLKFETQVREVLVLSEKFVPMWLAQINLTPAMQRKNPLAVQKLLKYQLEATDALHKAFYETAEQKEAFHSSLGLEGRIMEMTEIQKMQTVQINRMEETIDRQVEILSSVMDSMTLSTRQQEKILKAARQRVNFLLGGAHSDEYRRMGRTYLVNLWNNFKANLHCGSSYKDLNPSDFNKALDWIEEWRYTEA